MVDNIRENLENSLKSLASQVIEETYLKVLETLKNNFQNKDYKWVELRLKSILTEDLVADTMYYKDCISYLSAKIANIEGFIGCDKNDIKSIVYGSIMSLNSKEPRY